MCDFIHLHTHTHYSLLDGMSHIPQLMEKAVSYGMPAIAISDHGNLFGVPEFVLTARKYGIQPIVGCELYLCNDHRKPYDRNQNPTYHQIVFVMNEKGYHNLMKLTSIGYLHGFSYKPRIDRHLLAEYNEGLLITSCCIQSEINQTILTKGEEEAEHILRAYLDIFGRDRFLIEIQDHGLEKQKKCNQVLLKWVRKYNLRVVVTNDVHYVEKADAEIHDILLAIQTGTTVKTPGRFRFTDDLDQLNPNFYFKSPDEMRELFTELLEDPNPNIRNALKNTLYVAEQSTYAPPLNGELILPIFQIPPNFSSMMEYLRHLTYEGAKTRYPVLTDEIRNRIDYELSIIEKMGFEGYFLIVQEFTNEARKLGVKVGPGRGSAAGSVVAYCLGIIDIDPLQYDLLFERFLNPERVSPPDIDIDFDDEGREKVIEFVIQKYGRESVCQIVTFGTMGAKTAIRDVGRALEVPLSEVNRIAKLIPEVPGMTFEKALDPTHNPDALLLQKEMESWKHRPNGKLFTQMFEAARRLEGTVRHTGVHAAGVIIAPGNLTDYIPLAKGRDNVIVSQFDGPHAELAGMLKMDFLGLKTLSIIKTAVKMIKEVTGEEIDIDHVPLDDPLSFELFQKGETIAIFQFESEGMRAYLKQLKPTTIEDLIAMNALYRPGPMENIPHFIKRKHGEEEITYPHPLLEPILKNTYGIMVYQEQIMQVAQVMAGYSLGEADLLRRAMGKKKKEVMEKERDRFIARSVARGIDREDAERVFDTMERFAEYGFNKSHAAAYSILAYRTAYLKAHYPDLYMAAVLTHWVHDTKKVAFFIEEAKRLNIQVLPPSVNDSQIHFSVSNRFQIRYGLAAIKGVGISTAEAIVSERLRNGPYRSIQDFVHRLLKLNQINKRILESLALAGALDCFSYSRQTYVSPSSHNQTVSNSEELIRRIQLYMEEQRTKGASLFEQEETQPMEALVPFPNEIPEMPNLQKLKYEKEYIGLYITGHPLDEYRAELECLNVVPLNQISEFVQKEIFIAGMITSVKKRIGKNQKEFGVFVIEDYTHTFEFRLFDDNYFNYALQLPEGKVVAIKAFIEPSNNSQVPALRIISVIPLPDLINQILYCKIRILNDDLSELIVRTLIKELDRSPKGQSYVDIELTDHSIWNHSLTFRLHRPIQITKPLFETFYHIKKQTENRAQFQFTFKNSEKKGDSVSSTRPKMALHD